MNLGGIKISSAEIERVLNQVDSVVETAAVAMSKDGGPDHLIVFVVVDDEAITTGKREFRDLKESELLATMNGLLKTQLNPLFKIRTIEVVESMPRTASGKVMRRKLRDQLDT